MIVDLDDGTKAHAATGGVSVDGDDPTVVLIHGAGMDATVWQLQTRFLAHRGYRPVAIDLPGHGRTSGEPRQTVAAMGDWVAAFIDVAGLAPAHIVGHSMGTFIALEVAAKRPDLVRSLVLLGTADAMGVHPDLLTAAAEDLPAAAALMASWAHDRPAHVGLNPTPGQWMIGGARALVEMSEPGVLAADFTAVATYEEATTTASQVSCPVSVVVGLGDRMTPPRAAAKLVEVLTNPTVLELADTGHMMMFENPRAVRQLLLEALAP